jgi:multicomponent Na+:H+ antiporter subunit E
MIFTLLFLFWIILNANLTLEIILFGAFFSALVTMFSYKILRVTPSLEKKAFLNLFLIIKYLLILIVEIIKANIDVIKLVLSKEPDLSPTLKTIKVDLKSRVSLVALANSITLTPGTITVSMNKNELLIHAIKKDNLVGIEESVFITQLQEMED